MSIPPRTSIALGLRVIPPGSGIDRSARRPSPRVGHQWQREAKYALRVVKDDDLEQEIEQFRKIESDQHKHI